MVCVGMAGAGRAAQLHLDALAWVRGVPLRLKRIAGPEAAQVFAARERYGFEAASSRFADLLDDPDVNVVDICTPPHLHEEMVLQALAAGKHVICEKPLTGCFCPAEGGGALSKAEMYGRVLASGERLRRAVEASGRQFMYAENFVYAPAILRAEEMILRRKSRILFFKGEESVNGSSSPVAGEWSKSGGGAFLRVGAHPLAAALWLKGREAAARGETIRVKSVTAEMGRAADSLDGHARRHLRSPARDVEDQGAAILTFSDGTRGVIMAAETLLGGSKNYVELYCNDGTLTCTLTLTDLMETFLPDEEGLDGFFLSELLPSKLGWNRPALADEVIRGYVGQMQDFAEAVHAGRPPRSGFDLAYETVRVLYAAYASSEAGKRVELTEEKNL